MRYFSLPAPGGAWQEPSAEQCKSPYGGSLPRLALNNSNNSHNVVKHFTMLTVDTTVYCVQIINIITTLRVQLKSQCKKGEP